MAAIVISSLQDDAMYFTNLDFLRQGLIKGTIQFDGHAHNTNDEFPFESNRTYDFVRSAGAKIREAMTTHLTSILDGIDEHTQGDLRQAFGKLFSYHTYRSCLEKEGQKRGETLRLFIFNPEEEYVAHINFSCNTVKGAGNNYTVHTAITCQKFTPFEPQDEDYMEAIMIAIQNLHVTGQ